MPDDHSAVPVLEFDDAGLSFGPRRLWSGLSLRVEAGEFVAVLGANGSGKTSLVRAILGLQRLSSGRLRVSGRPPRRGGDDIGYVPQQRRIDPLTPLRARDVVGQGLDGHRWGLGRRPGRDGRIRAALGSVDAAAFADMPVGLLSGGEQQRIRVAQALVADPRLLLCDEPLLSLDLRSQQTITALVDKRRREKGTAVVFVTHEINPVLPYVDRVLYLADGGFRSGTVQEVFTSETLSDLYGVPIEVLRVNGRILVAGIPPANQSHHHHDGAEVGVEHV
ncbi:ABC transporter ATP-binding protein [Micromonospora sp. WMMD961]|uniref:metal ABC transporter ATP-binding protein n=1 Tax=Micromonospora sp. WMMD961 TaxID=3016100 RepID=UPI002417C942|nr:ABC transporter ATP-binding protein [Micromonospora sp. WMMD961]MDG4782334.1 ABC transporter ATP-binding protein [Micromonospora sp. WMMD961]